MACTRVGAHPTATLCYKQLKASFNNLQLLAVLLLTDADDDEEESDA